MSVAERLGYVSRASSKSLVDIFVEMPFNSHVIGSLPSRKASDGLGSTGHLNRPEWEVIFPLVRTWQPAAKSRFLKFFFVFCSGLRFIFSWIFFIVFSSFLIEGIGPWWSSQQRNCCSRSDLAFHTRGTTGPAHSIMNELRMARVFPLILSFLLSAYPIRTFGIALFMCLELAMLSCSSAGIGSSCYMPLQHHG